MGEKGMNESCTKETGNACSFVSQQVCLSQVELCFDTARWQDLSC